MRAERDIRPDWRPLRHWDVAFHSSVSGGAQFIRNSLGGGRLARLSSFKATETSTGLTGDGDTVVTVAVSPVVARES